ncbi:MAG: cyclase family protein [Candidatus Dadabacteria bacterium]|nr:cyclase family protein [Candidatus Dadabacteria bacterium]NIQ14422.1 cyclase family protein [Candidatus Dadabacteria bacterium]
MKIINSLVFLILFFTIAACSKKVINDFSKGRWIDLSHSYSKETIYWPTAEGFKIKTDFEGYTDKGYYYSAYSYCTAEHGGTHLDAPIHFYEKGNTVDLIPLSQLIGEAIVVDVSKKALADADYQVTVDDFKHWEAINGGVPYNSIVILKTGYGRYWPDRVKYMGTAERGSEAVKKLHFPGLHPDAATWLVKERNIKAIGLDTPSIDYGQSSYFKSHQILFEHNIPAFENLANIERLPVKGATVIALPMKIEGGSGGPLRIIAFIPE